MFCLYQTCACRWLVRIFLCLIFCPFGTTLFSQTAWAAYPREDSSHLPTTYISKVSARADQLQVKLTQRSQRLLERFQLAEMRLAQKLKKTDSVQAMRKLNDSKARYEELMTSLQRGDINGFYDAGLDTLTSSLNFLKTGTKLPGSQWSQEQLNNTVGKLELLKSKFGEAEVVKQFVQQRKQYLTQQLSELGLLSELKRLNKQVYYYNQQLSEYKSLLRDRDKAIRKALTLLREAKPFRDFMQRNSQLAALFGQPGEAGSLSEAGQAGLQTREMIDNLINSRVSAGGPNAAAAIQTQLREAQGEMSALKERLTKLGGTGNSEADLPDNFRPNGQKTKSLLNRLEYGANLQHQRGNSFLPVTSDIGLSVGYKLNDRSIIGIGASYKLGWGQNLRNLALSSQGTALRSFIDWKIKGSFWVSGGYELNYRSVSIPELAAPWRPSGLIGLSKVVSLKSAVLKKTRMMVLWDFLSYQRAPRTPPVVIRFGYGLN